MSITLTIESMIAAVFRQELIPEDGLSGKGCGIITAAVKQNGSGFREMVL